MKTSGFLSIRTFPVKCRDTIKQLEKVNLVEMAIQDYTGQTNLRTSVLEKRIKHFTIKYFKLQGCNLRQHHRPGGHIHL